MNSRLTSSWSTGLVRSALALAALPLLGSPASAQGDTTIFVIAGTKSMSGALEGRSKIEIVREAIGWNLAGRPAGHRVGIVSFGSRSANDCTDVTITAPPAGIRPADISTNLSKVTPKGRAPVGDAMRVAASFLPPGAAGSLVVITDSLDSCKGDPCAIAAELKAANAALKIDVVALGLKPADQAKLMCMATQTGGAFAAATTPGDVIAALAGAPPAAVVAAAAPAATDTVTKDGVSITFPATAEAGAYGAIEFTGPNEEGDWIGIVEKGANAQTWLNGAYENASEASPAKVTMPSTPGSYEIRYVSRSQGVLASKPLEITPSEVTLDAPEAVVGGAPVAISFKGPMGHANTITIVGASEPDNKQDNYNYRKPSIANFTLRAPFQVGDYEVRYLYRVGENKVIARKPLRVTEPVSATLEPIKAKAGQSYQVKITSGPRFQGDLIYVSRPGAADADYSGGYTNAATKGNITLTAPKDPGEWELRYVINDQGTYKAIGRASLTVE